MLVAQQSKPQEAHIITTCYIWPPSDRLERESALHRSYIWDRRKNVCLTLCSLAQVRTSLA